MDEKRKFQQIRLFKWSKKRSDYTTSCLIIFHVVNDIYSSKEWSHVYTSLKYPVHFTTDAIHFFSDRDVAKGCIHITAINSGLFFSIETIRTLAKDVANHLFGCFRFNIASFYEPAAPTYVIVVHIFASTLSSARPTVEAHLRHEDLRPYMVDSNYIDDSVKNLLTNIRCSTMKVDCVLGVKEFFTCVEPLVKPVCYNIVDGINGDEGKCSICFEDYKSGIKVMVTSCSHKFHAKCLIEWLLRKDSCQLCIGLCVLRV